MPRLENKPWFQYSAADERTGDGSLEGDKKLPFGTVEKFLGEGELDRILGLRAPFIRGPGIQFSDHKEIRYTEQTDNGEQQIGRSEIHIWVERGRVGSLSPSGKKGSMHIDYATDDNICGITVKLEPKKGSRNKYDTRSVSMTRGEGIHKNPQDLNDIIVPAQVRKSDPIIITTQVPLSKIPFEAPFLTDIADTKIVNSEFIARTMGLPDAVKQSKVEERIGVDPQTYELRSRSVLMNEAFGGILYQFGINGEQMIEEKTGKVIYKEKLL